MEICTDKIEDIASSVSKLFSCSAAEFETFARSLYDGCVEGSIIYGDRIKLKVRDFISDYASSHIDKVCMHHLSRRLDGYNRENALASNLHYLLLTESSLSNFLDSYGIRFYKDDGIIRMFYHGSEVTVGLGSQASMRIKLRLGQFEKGAKDHCINGFAFADRIEKTGYYNNLSRGPEILNGYC